MTQKERGRREEPRWPEGAEPAGEEDARQLGHAPSGGDSPGDGPSLLTPTPRSRARPEKVTNKSRQGGGGGGRGAARESIHNPQHLAASWLAEATPCPSVPPARPPTNLFTIKSDRPTGQTIPPSLMPNHSQPFIKSSPNHPLQKSTPAFIFYSFVAWQTEPGAGALAPGALSSQQLLWDNSCKSMPMPMAN